jgi:hypothetical protein
MICAWMLTSSDEMGSSAMMNFRRHGERARDRDALPLTAGELVRKLPGPRLAVKPTATKLVDAQSANPLQSGREAVKRHSARRESARPSSAD